MRLSYHPADPPLDEDEPFEFDAPPSTPVGGSKWYEYDGHVIDLRTLRMAGVKQYSTACYVYAWAHGIGESITIWKSEAHEHCDEASKAKAFEDATAEFARLVARLKGLENG